MSTIPLLPLSYTSFVIIPIPFNNVDALKNPTSPSEFFAYNVLLLAPGSEVSISAYVALSTIPSPFKSYSSLSIIFEYKLNISYQPVIPFEFFAYIVNAAALSSDTNLSDFAE